MKMKRDWIGCVALGMVAAMPCGAEDFLLVDEGAAALAWVPDSAEVDGTWTAVADPANSGDWKSGVTGVGYERGNGYAGLIGLDVNAEIEAVGGAEGCYVRIPFTVEQEVLAGLRGLTLRMKYDDGFVAYLNGVLLEAVNADLPTDWQSGASGQNSDAAAVEFEDFDVTGEGLAALVAGANVLAIHGLNDGANSSDFLIRPALVGSDEEPPVLPELQLREVTRGLSRPVGMSHAGDGTGRVFVLEQRGTVRIFNSLSGRMEAGNFLDIQSLVMSPADGGGNNERGLLGIAFPSGYGEVGKRHFYVNYTSQVAARRGDTVVARFSLTADDDVADPGSEEILLVEDQPNSNHNAGQINFGTDGMLYIALGDGGSGNDPGEHAQDPQDLLGKMLRIDVEGVPDPGKAYAVPGDNPFVGNGAWLPEIWAYGLRNPWRWSFDRLTGEMWIGDVGQGALEEVGYAPAGSPGGIDFGWDFYEGTFRNTSANRGMAPAFETTSAPVFEYGRGGGTSITGGYVYRGERFPRMYGKYWVGDYNSGRVWMVEPDGVGGWASAEVLGGNTSRDISAFGEDEAGELYLVDLSGEIYVMEDTRDAGYLQLSGSGFADITGNFRFSWGTEVGKRYRVEESADLVTWADVGEVTTASGYEMSYEAVGGISAKRYFRVRELD
ncbi:MAG: PQQ-dependent sugar dehydrogenase [Verrucomicrobiales bacterium]|nr:PQQ-dependent sugar dehydrogenase [Verrucomicrobiales bacterium]